MRILIVLVPKFDPNSGGVQMSTFKLASYFNSQNLDVSIFSFTNSGHVVPDFVDFYSANEGKVNYNEVNINKCIEVVKKVKPDVIIQQMPYEFNIGSALKGIKDEFDFLLLGCLRGSFFAVKNNLETYRKTLLPKPIQFLFKNSIGYNILLQIHKFKHGQGLKKIMDTYDYYVLFGESNKIELEYFIGKYKQDKLRFIPNSIPSVQSSVPPKEKRILWLSRVDYRQKHAELIIPLWERIKDKLPDWEFDLVGSGGALEDIKAKATEMKLERFNIYGKQNPDKFYSRSPIYIMTSSFEGFPNTLIEAQSYGCIPVVFDSYPMLKEIVNPDNSILINTFNLDEMTQKIVDLSKDEIRIEKMSFNSLTNANRFKISEVGKLWLNLFENRTN